MIAWRVWFARNEVTHEKELPSIEGSRRFLCSYMQSIENIKDATTEQIVKGKQIVGQDLMVRRSVRSRSRRRYGSAQVKESSN
jgi:hypothetical protein